MATTPEGKVKEGIKGLLKLYANVWYCMPVTGGYGVSGVPDFLICVNGKFLAVEAKAGNGTTSALQDLALERIRRSGGATLVLYEDMLPTLDSYLLFLGGRRN